MGDRSLTHARDCRRADVHRCLCCTTSLSLTHERQFVDVRCDATMVGHARGWWGGGRSLDDADVVAVLQDCQEFCARGRFRCRPTNLSPNTTRAAGQRSQLNRQLSRRAVVAILTSSISEAGARLAASRFHALATSDLRTAVGNVWSWRDAHRTSSTGGPQPFPVWLRASCRSALDPTGGAETCLSGCYLC